METGIQVLALPDHGVKTKHAAAGPQVFDPLRRRWVALTPEEWVRQHFLNHLIIDLNWPAGRIIVEHGLRLNGLSQRADIVLHGPDGAPLALVECKAPSVPITQRTFEQAGRYNTVFKVPFLLVTNGFHHYCCRLHHATGKVEFLSSLPDHDAMLGTLAD